MLRRIPVSSLPKRLKRCHGTGDYWELTGRLLLQGSVKHAASVAQVAIKRYANTWEASDAPYIDLGICEWLLGHKEKAVEAWRGGLNTPYRDPAGGVFTRLLLWFAGAMDSNAALLQEAVSLLEHALTSPRATGWPARIAEHLLDRGSETDVFDAAGKIDQRQGNDFRVRESLLYVGAKEFQEGSLDRARDCFARCTENLVEALSEFGNNDRLLAAYELRRLDPSAPSPFPKFPKPRVAKAAGRRKAKKPAGGTKVRRSMRRQAGRKKGPT